MAEKIISPGVFTNEIDATFLPSAVADIGAAIIGPTVKGPALIPTVVSSYSEFQQIFGDVQPSGSDDMQYLTSHTAEQYLRHSDSLTIVRILEGSPSHATANVVTGSGNYFTGSAPAIPIDSDTLFNKTSFKLHTLAHGHTMNNNGSGSGTTVGATYYPSASLTGSNGVLLSGSKHNLRWEVAGVNPTKGTFNLVIRRGDDTHKRKQILETFNNINLDPNSNNYIAKAVGDTVRVQAGTESEPFIELSGSHPNISKYVRVEVLKKTTKYLDENGNIRLNSLTGMNHPSASLPGEGSGSWHGSFAGGSSGYTGFDALGNGTGKASGSMVSFYEKIGAETQGYNPQTATEGAEGKTAYTKALNLLSNNDEYDFNLLLLPGLEQTDHSTIIDKAIITCEDRGDCFVIVDPVPYDKKVANATAEAGDYDSNFAAMYWPWVMIPDNIVGTQRWVPPSVPMAGIFAFNDKVAHPWFAPAGLNRGGLDTAIQAEKKLTQSDRDTLYDSNVNPIATFPGQGVTVFGQKTLQKKSSALDRINVRRLLIRVKKFISASSRFLLFEQNNAATRRRFLDIVNPFLETVQSQSGLSAFRVVMDETNNTPDTIDRNILYGQLFLQPTRTAEFIILDFTIQPTGAAFPE
tara:strand:- start:2332 stop:4233 length:1902 start_codon:yes stop_codon:yes gene_type:complete